MKKHPHIKAKAMPRNSSSSSSRPAPPPCAPPAWAEMGINEPPPPLFPDRRQQYHARAADGWVGQGSWSEVVAAAVSMQHQWQQAQVAQRKAQNAAKAAKRALARVQQMHEDMATRGNLEAAEFLMRQKMTGKRLIGSLPKPMSAYPVTQMPGDDEESFEEAATVLQPAPEGEVEPGGDDHDCVYCVAGNDYEHTLVLESQHEEEDHVSQVPDENAADGEQTMFEGIPDDDTQPDDVQTLFLAGDDRTVFPEDDPAFFEDDADDDATICPAGDDLPADATHDGVSVPIGAFKKRRTS